MRCFLFWPQFQRAKYREMSNSHDRKSAVVEMQCFVDNEGRFIVKELAIVSGNIQSHWVFKPPYDSTKLDNKALRTNRWAEKYYHGLAWLSGDTPYEALERIIRRFCIMFDRIYTRGSEKCTLLTKILEPLQVKVINVDTIALTPPDDQKPLPRCLRHASNQALNHRCALHKASLLYQNLPRKTVARHCCPIVSSAVESFNSLTL